jgi:hypothetical protein
MNRPAAVAQRAARQARRLLARARRRPHAGASPLTQDEVGELHAALAASGDCELVAVPNAGPHAHFAFADAHAAAAAHRRLDGGGFEFAGGGRKALEVRFCLPRKQPGQASPCVGGGGGGEEAPGWAGGLNSSIGGGGALGGSSAGRTPQRARRADPRATARFAIGARPRPSRPRRPAQTPPRRPRPPRAGSGRRRRRLTR